MQSLSRFWQRWQGWLKIGGTAILLAYLLKTIPLAEMWQNLQQISPAALAGSFLIFALSNILFAAAWAIALNILRFDLSFLIVCKLFFQSLFINNFATFVGGDSLRVYQVSRSRQRIMDATLSVFISRIVMLYAILLLAGVMIWGWADTVNWGKQSQNLGAGLTIFLLIAIPLLSFFNKRSVLQQVKKNKVPWMTLLTTKLSEIHQKLHGHAYALLLVLLVSILAQLTSAWAVWVLAKAIDIPINWTQLLLCLSIVGIALILPISFNGIGIREVGLVGLLTSINIDGSQALALSLSTSLLVIITSLIGGIFLLADFIQTQRNIENPSN